MPGSDDITSPVGRGALTQREEDAQLRLDFAVQLFSGLHRAVANDGTVEMTESDAAYLLRAGWVRADADELAGTGRGGPI